VSAATDWPPDDRWVHGYRAIGDDEFPDIGRVQEVPVVPSADSDLFSDRLIAAIVELPHEMLGITELSPYDGTFVGKRIQRRRRFSRSRLHGEQPQRGRLFLSAQELLQDLGGARHRRHRMVRVSGQGECPVLLERDRPKIRNPALGIRNVRPYLRHQLCSQGHAVVPFV